jgi:two-component system response regulator DesR
MSTSPLDPHTPTRDQHTITVVIAEDQGMVLGALAALLELENDIEVVGQAADGDQALKLVHDLAPDVLLTDIEMPGLTGLEVAAALRAERPAPGSKPRVIVLTTFARTGYLKRALDAGAAGYLLKEAPASQLADAIRTVAAGGRSIDPELAMEAWGEVDPLTDRERQVLRAAAQGDSTAAIAERLHLSDGTVRNYLSEAIGKLGAANRVEAARLARERGWL